MRGLPVRIRSRAPDLTGRHEASRLTVMTPPGAPTDPPPTRRHTPMPPTKRGEREWGDDRASRLGQRGDRGRGDDRAARLGLGQREYRGWGDGWASRLDREIRLRQGNAGTVGLVIIRVGDIGQPARVDGDHEQVRQITVSRASGAALADRPRADDV